MCDRLVNITEGKYLKRFISNEHNAETFSTSLCCVSAVSSNDLFSPCSHLSPSSGMGSTSQNIVCLKTCPTPVHTIKKVMAQTNHGFLLLSYYAGVYKALTFSSQELNPCRLLDVWRGDITNTAMGLFFVIGGTQA